MGEGLAIGPDALIAWLAGQVAGAAGSDGGAAQTRRWLEEELGRSHALRLAGLVAALAAGGAGSLAGDVARTQLGGGAAQMLPLLALAAGSWLAAQPAAQASGTEPTRSLGAAALVLAWRHLRGGGPAWLAALAWVGLTPLALASGYLVGWLTAHRLHASPGGRNAMGLRAIMITIVFGIPVALLAGGT